jgi:CheY-like chemotaxis protein
MIQRSWCPPGTGIPAVAAFRRESSMPTALIVEDEPEANKLLAMLLQLRGYRTESAFFGAEALEKIRKHAPDVVFLDLMLPDMDGYDVCRSLKTSEGVSVVPIVIVTARLTAENRIESFAAGADDYVPKPYTPDQIFAALDQSGAWKELLDAPRLDGEVALDSRDDGQALRQLAHLRRLLQLRCTLEPNGIDRISSAIKSLWSSVDAWSRQRGQERVAALTYSLTPEALTLTIRDEAGWLAATPSAMYIALNAGDFDDVIHDLPGGSLTLVKRCRQSEDRP